MSAPFDVRVFYDRFSSPVTEVDCGSLCAPHNVNGKPFCCDICHTVPVAYHAEWEDLQARTDLWHIWRGDECASDPCDPAVLRDQTPDHLLLLACRGPAFCQREYRSSSCRMFPFFPYITSDDRFIGLAYEWDFEPVCWVISHLDAVTDRYREEFVRAYDDLFAVWQEEFDNFADISAEMRDQFAAAHRRIPLLHRSGGCRLISPASERMVCTDPASLRRFGPYR